MARAVFALLCRAIVLAATFGAASIVTGTSVEPPLVRIAELKIDPGQLAAYRNALSEEIVTSIRVEPGVLNLFAVAVKGNPAQVRIFELYKDQAAYEAHLQTPHFKKYKTETQNMVKALKLIETDPIMLGTK